MAALRSTSEQFNDSYNQKGLQPSTGSIFPIRNVKTEYKNDPTVRRGGKQTVRTTTGTTMQATGTTIQATGIAMQATGKAANVAGSVTMGVGAALSATAVGSVIGVPLMAAGFATRAAGTVVDKSGKVVSKSGKVVRKAGSRLKKNGRGGSKSINNKLIIANGALARGRVTTLNIWIWAAGFVTWKFQLIFGILSLVFLGLALAIESFTSKLNPTEGDGFFTKAIKGTTQFLLDVTTWFGGKIFDVFKIDISILNPTNIFLMTYMMVLAYGIFILFAIYLIYKISLFNPLSGRGAGMKKGAFLLALVGYSIPILNLFPWFIFWTMAVWRHPK